MSLEGGWEAEGAEERDDPRSCFMLFLYGDHCIQL